MLPNLIPAVASGTCRMGSIYIRRLGKRSGAAAADSTNMSVASHAFGMMRSKASATGYVLHDAAQCSSSGLTVPASGLQHYGEE